MTKKNLSIAMTTDHNYILQTKVAIFSMLRSANKDTLFRIHILCSPRLAGADRQKILNLQDQWNNAEICFHEIDEKIFQNVKTTYYVPVASLYRLLISEIVDGDKCLFVDGDTIVNIDLAEIYDTDLTGMYLAGVKDCLIQHDISVYASYKDELGIPSMDNYINAGILLMNLKLIRESGMDRTFKSCIDHQYKMMDQDILNKCCYGRIKHLDLKYNFFMDYYKRLDRLGNTSFSQREITDAKEYDGILHFSGKYKPWKFIRIRGSHLWWESAKEALPPEDYDEIYKQAIDNIQKTDWNYILGQCRQAKDIIVVGFSEIGKDTAESLLRCGISDIRCFCDNSKEKQKAQYHDLMVYSVVEAFEKYPEALWVNTSQVSAKAISEQLVSIGVKAESILVYVHKSEQYYDNLDEQYQEYEKKLLAFKQSGKEI